VINSQDDFPPVENFFTTLSEQFSQLASLYIWQSKMTIPKREVFLILRAQTGDRAAFDELLKSVNALVTVEKKTNRKTFCRIGS
jgi:hypothetical protein